MDSLLFKNIGSSALEVVDLGIYLEVDEEIDLLVNYRNEDILESSDIEGAMSNGGQVTLIHDSVSTILNYTQLIDYLTALTRYDTIDYTYISSKDVDTDVTGAELEQLTNGSDNSLHIHDNRYYTKTELSTSNIGTVEIHWDNIINAPQFGSLNWKTPVDRTDTSYGSGTTLPTVDNLLNDARMVADDGDGKPAQYVCIATSGTWSEQWIKIADVDWGSANSISSTANGNLTSTNVQDALYELQSDIDTINTIFPTIDFDYTYNNGSVVIVDNTDVDFQLSDTKTFKITNNSNNIFSVTSNSSINTISLDGVININGLSSNVSISTLNSGNIVITSIGDLLLKDQYLTNSISLSESGVTGLDSRFTKTSIIGAINETLDIAVGSNTLDDSYDGVSGSGSGREITVDSGAVKLNATSNNYAPLELTELTTPPSLDLANGQLAFINGILYVYDNVRTKWLSINELHYDWADQFANGKYLKIGNSLGTNIGFKIPLNATIVKVVARATSGNLSKTIEIRKNNDVTPIKTFTLSSGEYMSLDDNIDITAGDFLQVYTTWGGGFVRNPVVSIYLKWRV